MNLPMDKHNNTDGIANFKILWFAIVVASLFGSWLLGSGLWFRFMDSPTRLSIISKYKPTNTIPFPAVTMCSSNRMRKTNIKKFLQSLTYIPKNKTLDDIERYIPQLNSMSSISILHHHDDLSILQEVMDRNRYKIEDVVILLAQSCKDFLVRCLWEGEIVSCMDFFETSFTSIGSCCSFNYKINKRQKYTPKYTEYYGPYLGLSVVFDVMKSDAVDFISNINTLIVVHAGLQYPIFRNNIVVAENSHEIFIGVKATKKYSSEELASLSDENRDCTLPNERNLKYFSSYGEANCRIECYMNLTLSRCGCIPLFYPKRSHEKICQLNDLDCTHLIMAGNVNTTYTSGGYCNCLYRCNNVYYTITRNTIKLHQEAVGHSLSALYAGLNNQNISYGVAHIYFSNQVATLARKDILTSWTNLISNLGGVFGLFLGFSFVSLAEFTFYIWVKVKSLLGYGHAKRAKRSINSPKIKYYTE